MIAPVGTTSAEIPRMFLPTPERLSSLSFLKLKSDEVQEMLRSIKGRRDLVTLILPHTEDIRALHPEFDPAFLPMQLETVSMVYQEKERFIDSARNPEKAGLFRRAWESIKRFPRNHPFITAGIVVAVLAGGLSYFGYLPQLGEWWEKLKAFFHGKFGIGRSGIGGAGPGEGAAAGVEGESAKGVVSVATEAVQEGSAALAPDAIRIQQVLKAAESFSAGPNDFIVTGRHVLFGGKLYDVAHLEPLAQALKDAGLDLANPVRILRDESARVTAWQGLMSFLKEQGVDNMILSKDLLKIAE